MSCNKRYPGHCSSIGKVKHEKNFPINEVNFKGVCKKRNRYNDLNVNNSVFETNRSVHSNFTKKKCFGHSSSIGKINKQCDKSQKRKTGLNYSDCFTKIIHVAVPCPVIVEVPVEVPVKDEVSIPIEKNDIDCIYDKFINPFLDVSPLAIGSVDLTVPIITRIEEELSKEIDESTRKILLIFRDIIAVIFCAQYSLIEKKICEREKNIIQNRYDLSIEENKRLNERILELQQLIDPTDRVKKFGLEGQFAISGTTVKSAIYLVARFDIVKAWYLYLYRTTKVNVMNYKATVNYVKQFKTNIDAYNNLIEKLDFEFDS